MNLWHSGTVASGLIQELRVGSTFDRFDGNTAPHYHFVCNDCGEMADIELPARSGMDRQVRELTKARVDYHRLDFYGSFVRCVRERKEAFSNRKIFCPFPPAGRRR